MMTIEQIKTDKGSWEKTARALYLLLDEISDIRAAGANPASHTPEEIIEGLGLAPLQVAVPSMALNNALAASLNSPPPPSTPEEIARVQSMLAAIPANCDRVTWRNIIWAVAATGWDYAESLAREWSNSACRAHQQSPKPPRND